MKQMNYKKLIIPNIPYVFFVYLFDKVGQAVRLAPGADISEKILNITQGFSEAFSNALPSVHPLDLLIGIVGAVVIRLIVYFKGKNARKYRKGAEYGSARWGNAEDIKPYIDPDFQNNIILTQTERLTMNSRPKSPKYARNKNVVVIGGSGRHSSVSFRALSRAAISPPQVAVLIMSKPVSGPSRVFILRLTPRRQL